MQRVFRKTEGVSLIELMVALTVVAILALVTAEYQRQKLVQDMNQSRAAQASTLMREFLDIRKKVISCATGDLTPNPANSTNPLTSLLIPSRNKSGTFNETLSNRCDDSPPSLAGLNWVNPSCASPICGNGKVPKVVIQRSGVAGPEIFPPGSGDGLDGYPIGAALCMRTNDGSANYRDIHFDLHVLFRASNNSIKVVRQQANIPRPKRFIEGVSISICP